MNVLAAEKDDRETFQDLPFHYMELASLLLDRFVSPPPQTQQITAFHSWHGPTWGHQR